jgi:DNA-binding MarR family transcriptional regulator
MPSRTYDLLERIASLMRAEQRRVAGAAGLEPVHLQALHYLSQANRFSDTPRSVGEYLGLTKGNVSQRLIWLETRGYLQRTPDAQDGRIVHLRLTPTGRRALASACPPPLWRKAAGAAAALERPLEDLLQQLLERGGYRGFGQCRTCRFHEPGPYCALLQVALEPAQADKICREHEPPAGRSA